MEKLWNVFETNQDLQNTMSSSLSIHPIVAQLLINRNITDLDHARMFLSAKIDDLHDPFLFKHMDVAVERIQKAQSNGEKVMIHGDYDVDGVTSTTLLNQLMKKLGIDVVNHIPHRMTDGYGLNAGVGKIAKAQNVKLIITVDCGVTAFKEVDTINACGIDVIIIDHHEPSDGKIPNAVAVVDPKQSDCMYPFKSLASAGLVAKMYQAVFGCIDEEMLDLVALGTVADIAPLHGENRIFVKHGLSKIKETKNLGLNALLEIAKIKGKVIKPYHIGFMLGPRINAAGRMDSALTALDLFLADNEITAIEYALKLEQYNVDRQKTQKNMVQEAFDMIDQDETLDKQNVIVLASDSWHKGIVGIVASRVKDKYFRPAIIIAIKDGVGTASARSVEGFHLHEALTQCQSSLENFGGHAGAAGLTIKEENLDVFKKQINEVAGNILEEKKFLPKLDIDMEISLAQIDVELANVLEGLEPYGEGNPSPIFCSTDIRVNSIPQTLGKNTLKFWAASEGCTISAVGFGMADFKNQVNKGDVIDIAYQISIDDWNKAPVAQIILKDIKVRT